ncbi:MAG: hypothetical protein R2749_06705 [Acidimicrobiales bacterium]
MISMNNMTTVRRSWWRDGGADLVALMAVAALAVAGAVVTGLVRVAGNWGERRMPLRVDAGEGVEVVAPAGFVAEDIGGTLTGSPGSYALWSVGQVLILLAVAAIAVAVLLVVNDARRGEPFSGRNVRRWAVAAGACVVGQIGGVVTSLGELNAKMDSEVTASTTLSFAWIGLFLVFVALVSVFRKGNLLRDDVELTV